MNNFLAKSNPRETIQEHTDKLLDNFHLLKNLYKNIRVNWDVLECACLYHDLGKMNVKFQSKVDGGKKYTNEIAHNLLSLAFLDINELKKRFSKEEIILLAQAIAFHHERGDYSDDNYNEEVELLKNEIIGFKYEKVKITDVKKISAKYFSNNRIHRDESTFFEYVKIKGLLNRLDYSASAGIEVEIKNDFLINGLRELQYVWNELQTFMCENQHKNIVAVAQTGMGKTEAGLLWIGDNKGFFTLPLKTAINEIYKRITQKITGQQKKNLVGLLHSDTYIRYIENKTIDEDIEEYYVKTRQLSLPLTICTLDQLFDIVFRYRGFEHKLATLSYSKIVIDEVQMYSDDLLAYLILGLLFITQIGGKFAILTATLPGILVDLLNKENIPFVVPEKAFIDDSYIRHSLKVENDIINSKYIANKYENNRVLVICNTVKKAQEIYNNLKDNKKINDEGVEVNLLHSKFIKKDRKEKEKMIVKFGKQEAKSGIWVTTQIVEASLDIDFDVLITELSDINGLFQRMGRCYRKRQFKSSGYNCYVFDGGEKLCSGVGRVIDKDIFVFSKNALKGINGKVTESQKLDMIREVYSTEKLKNTQYYKNVIKNIEYIKCIDEYELNKNEVNKRFRNIDNIAIIPRCVYNSNHYKISELISILNTSKDKEEKHKTREQLFEYTVEVRYYEINGKPIERISISKHNEIKICEGFSYNAKIGLEATKKKHIQDNHVSNINNNIV